MAKASTKRIEYNDTYNREHYDLIRIRPRIELGQRIRSAAADSGQSVNRWILDAVRDKLGIGDPDASGGH